ncbi:hypothetical protein ACSD62_004113 [Escherichia coli]|nr:hypothetical protein [Escherichia coli]HCB3938058.1 hypothetical protein [Escherichia coli]HCH7584038.1 hypothetical protein [Escherichia coli]HCI8011534.1 hypothetical protein [Escherichia coli]HCU1705001.1 hypothetical protein [Escherichia coli]
MFSKLAQSNIKAMF